MVANGEEGYLQAARAIMDTSDKIRAGIAKIPELRILGKSTFLIAITSDVVDPYFVQDDLNKKGWRMNGCQNPPGFHFCITGPQTQPGVAERFVKDLADAVEYAKHPTTEIPKSGFLYGMGSTPDGVEMLRLGLRGYMDAWYEYE
jgi:glutamate/tyrosine decarboxylase-like PLP-dependent enzyme